MKPGCLQPSWSSVFMDLGSVQKPSVFAFRLASSIWAVNIGSWRSRSAVFQISLRVHFFQLSVHGPFFIHLVSSNGSLFLAFTTDFLKQSEMLVFSLKEFQRLASGYSRGPFLPRETSLFSQSGRLHGAFCVVAASWLPGETGGQRISAQ